MTCPHLFAEVKTETLGVDQARQSDMNNLMWNNEGKVTSQ
jgi:hypothetical protein